MVNSSSIDNSVEEFVIREEEIWSSSLGGGRKVKSRFCSFFLRGVYTYTSAGKEPIKTRTLIMQEKEGRNALKLARRDEI